MRLVLEFFALDPRSFVLSAGLRIDYLDRPTTRRFVIVRAQDNPRRTSRSSSERELSPVVKRRSPSRVVHGPFASFLSSDETNDVASIDELIERCETLHRTATNEPFPLLYPVQFNLKSHAYPVRLCFLAGNPNLAKKLLFTGDVDERSELTLTQRLRLDQHKLDDVEKTLKRSVASVSSSRKAPLQTNFSILIASAMSNETNDDDDEFSLSRFISYLAT